MRRLAPWAAVWGLTLALMALTTTQSLQRYRELRSGWSWDLAWNNQWFWALVKGDQTLSVRPVNSWADEGPSIWVHTHLDPIRLAIVPFYALRPAPETLIVVHNVLIWLVIPAAFGLLRAETGSDALALSGTALVPLTPLLGPLVWNDFREMEFAIPFVLWAVQGFRFRRKGLAAFGVAGMLACREEFAIMLASFALLPPKAEEDVGTTFAWARTAVYLAAGWFLFAFFGYEHLMVSRGVPDFYLTHVGEPKPGLAATGREAWDFVAFGLGSWAVLALAAPRVAVLALPWVWAVSNGRWSLSQLADWRWHHVRYTAPMVATILAAGLIGYARLGTLALRRRHGWWLVAGLWLAAAAGLVAARRDLHARMDRIDWPISRAEAAEIWRWVDRVGPDDAVLASYEVSAPLSSRRLLFSNRLWLNFPRHYPVLDPEFRWIFLRKDDVRPEVFTSQGFEVVYRGDFIWIYRRGGAR